MTQAINLMPKEYRQKLGDHRVRRRFFVHAVVVLACVMGLAVQQRYALSERAASIESARKKFKELEAARAELNALKEEERRLVDELAAYQRTALPIELSRVVATLSAMVPEGVAVDVMRAWIEETQVSQSALDQLRQRVQHARTGRKERGATRRTLLCEITGHALGDIEISALLENLESNPLLDHVQLDYSRSATLQEAEVREFRVLFEIDLEKRYVPRIARLDDEKGGTP